MTARKIPHWIIIEQSSMALVCRRCGGRDLPSMPMPIKDWVRWSRAFGERHRNCQVKPEDRA